MLIVGLVTLREHPLNPSTSSPHYNPNARCAYHSDSPGHDTSNYWALKNNIQDMIVVKEIEFDPYETPNVIIALMPNHDKGVNSINALEDADSDCDLDC